MDRSPYDTHLDRNLANFTPLSPLSFFTRAKTVYPHRPAYAYGSIRRTWGEVYERASRLASALAAQGIGKNDTVAIIAPNIPAIFDAHFGVPMLGAVLNPINIRLDAATIKYILNHGNAKVLITDTRFAPEVKKALADLGRDDLLVIDIDDTETDEASGERLGEMEFEEFLSAGSADFDWSLPGDEWDAISLNYTSGTTSDPKGVVVHHRGAYLIAMGTIASWPFSAPDPNGFPVHMYVVPLFHCNGWGHAWALAANGGMSVLVRNITAKNLFAAIEEHKVTHFGGAPIVLSMLINASAEERRPFDWPINVYTAAAPPPPSVLHAIEAMGFRLTHVYGLTETYGHVVECAWQEDWNDLDADAVAAKKSRQGVGFSVTEDIQVMDPETMEPVPADGETIGEIMIRGNVVMKGYLNAPEATDAAFAGGYFHSGDLAVRHADGYVQIKDRSKDIIISGGENISSVEIEGVLYKHPDVLAAAVVAKPDEKWGETPCAFLEVRPGSSISEDDVLAFCRNHLAGFKMPKTVVFQELPKTSTGKIQKFVLREQFKA
ncbi:AMP-binding protein [Pseudahrensia aquimaris]|uniref:AMP-binding protein n=1 Tax=Pseudahrensia aquimaris TaxID=744461 RepID=A0ABW3F8Y7_9HYPH